MHTQDKQTTLVIMNKAYAVQIQPSYYRLLQALIIFLFCIVSIGFGIILCLDTVILLDQMSMGIFSVIFAVLIYIISLCLFLGLIWCVIDAINQFFIHNDTLVLSNDTLRFAEHADIPFKQINAYHTDSTYHKTRGQVRGYHIHRLYINATHAYYINLKNKLTADENKLFADQVCFMIEQYKRTHKALED